MYKLSFSLYNSKLVEDNSYIL